MRPAGALARASDLALASEAAAAASKDLEARLASSTARADALEARLMAAEALAALAGEAEAAQERVTALTEELEATRLEVGRALVIEGNTSRAHASREAGDDTCTLSSRTPVALLLKSIQSLHPTQHTSLPIPVFSPLRFYFQTPF